MEGRRDQVCSTYRKVLALTTLSIPMAYLLVRGIKSLAKRWRERFGVELLDPLWVAGGLSRTEVERFGRQVVLQQVGVAGQRSLASKGALIVGAGGLGCPVALYLSAAGVGRLGIVDDDEVAISNLHRQIGHQAAGVGQKKAESLKRACEAINGLCDIKAHNLRLRALDEAATLVADYDLVIDCTDAPCSRYLLNDAALAAGRPLVAPSAVGLSGQLAIYNYAEGPCLRCLFPTSPRGLASGEAVASCEENGVLGPVPGILGTLAALEALKILAGGGLAASCLQGKMLLYDAMDAGQPFRSMKIRRRLDCATCGKEVADRSATQSVSASVSTPVAPKSDEGLEIRASALRARLLAGQPSILLDVRPPTHFAVAHLQGSTNWPLPQLRRAPAEEVRRRLSELAGDVSLSDDKTLVVCVCRRGVDSLTAVRHVRQHGIEALSVAGGLLAMADTSESGTAAPALT